MPAPLGNQFAKGCETSGAPRTVSLSQDEMIALGKEMFKWVKDNNPLHLNEWYSIEKGFTYNQWKTFICCKEFFPYYERSLNLVGKQYLNKDSQVNPSISQRWQRVYFKDLRDEEDETAKYQSELKRSELDTKSEQYAQANSKLDAVLDQFSSLQSALKTSDNKAIKDQKS